MSSLRYLIVDDSPTVRLTIRRALTQAGTPADLVGEADSAMSAAEEFEKSPPDVVFIDISLPEGGQFRTGEGTFLDFLLKSPSPFQGGNDVARAMLNRNPQLKVIVCTGNPPDDPRVREMIKAGAFQLLEKPIRLAQVLDVVHAVEGELAAAQSPERPPTKS
jgi:DNA-binding NarL/FixJ family response regulator